MARKKHILFVCLGNIVRSPLAEHMFRSLAEEQGVGENYFVDSAGTGSWHIGEPPDPRMRRVAASQGLLYSGKARQFGAEDFDRFDLIIAMDDSNKSNLSRQAPTTESRSKIRLMREFDPFSEPGDPVPDPYYQGIEGFRIVFEIVERSCHNLLEALESGDLLPGS